MPTEFIVASHEAFNNYYCQLSHERKYTINASRIFARLPLNRFEKYIRLLLEGRSNPPKLVLVHLDHESFADKESYKELVKLIPPEKLKVL